MNDESSDQDIFEIELVEHGRGRSGTDVPTGTRGEGGVREGAASNGAPTTKESRRGRTAAIAAMAGVAGFVIGSILGGGGDRTAEPETATAPTTADVEVNPVKVTLPEPATVTTVDVDDVPLEPTLPPLDSPSVETGTIPTMVAVEELAVDERLAGLPFEIAAVRRDGALVRLNFLTGDRRFSFASVALDGVVAYRGGVLQLGGAESVLHSDSGGVHRVPEFSDAATLFHTPGSGRVWALDSALAAGTAGEAAELDGGGNPTQNSVQLPGPPLAVDRAGNWVVTVAGNTYTVTGGGATDLLTSGSLVALGQTVALAKECDDTAECEYVTIDRTTGERTPSGVPTSVALRFATQGESISPDGRFAITLATYPASTGVHSAATLVDLESGTTRRLTLALDNPDLDVYWTPDSSFAFFEIYGAIVAFDPEAHELLHVTERPSSVPEENGFVGFDVRDTGLVF